jgi:murein DD-endopeptidase MepM/ murein hydrolase activator NlpD
MNKRIFIILAMLIAFASATHVSAQEATPNGPVYIIQPGDSLSAIASRFNIPLADLMSVNNITDANAISAGAQLVIPGLEGFSGTLITEIVAYGDTFNSLSRRLRIDEALLRRLNHITSPSELYAGVSLVSLQQENAKPLESRISLAPGGTLLEEAVRNQTDPWTLVDVNELKNTWEAMPGDALYSLTGNGNEKATGLPSAFISAVVSPLPITQGSTTVIRVSTAPGVTLGGILVDRPLHFFPMEDGSQVALQGIFAMLDPGIYPLRLEASLPDGSNQSFEQMVVIQSGNYQSEKLSVPSEFIDPTVTKPEDQQVAAIVSAAAPTKLWNGKLSLPVSVPYCIRDWFGMRRSFNGSSYDYFHSGLDYGVCSPDHPFDIYAAAPGTVVFAGPLTVRGNATFIDHGWGVYTAYFHQEEIYVSVGQQVKEGQLIGKIGATGRVTGPHLHWEVWVNGIQVEPTDWLENAYP